MNLADTESGCPCGHKLTFCHRENARRWCGGTSEDENDRLRGLLTLWLNLSREDKHIVPGPNGKSLGDLTQEALQCR